jgi:fructose PTS system EIIBC or EIIC component
MRLVVVTACPTGIAHSEMAAESLETAAKDAGHEVHTEVHGASGAEKLDQALIDDAEAVIFAADAQVQGRERFSGLPSVHVTPREAIDNGADVVQRAEKAAEEGRNVVAAESGGDAGDGDVDEEAGIPTDFGGDGFGADLRRWLMTGVSYMIPFVVAGGIMIALAFAIGGAVEVGELDAYEDGGIAAMLNEIGGLAFSMLVPILAGFIAYGMADRPAIAPGLVGGLISNEIEAGFLGGIAAGLLAGWVVMMLKKINVPGQFQRLMPILVYPLVGTFIVGVVMIMVLGQPMADITAALEGWLEGLSGANAIVLGLIVGGMMAFDMGGPVNKVAYTFGIAALEAGSLEPMAAIMAAGMTPPLGMALATVLKGSLYTPAEKRAGQAAWVMGAGFITEGAIPFAAADPLRVIPSLMVGSAAAAAISMGVGATLNAPHGGVFVIGLIGNTIPYIIAIIIGAVITAILVNVLKSIGRDEGEAAFATSREEATASA